MIKTILVGIALLAGTESEQTLPAPLPPLMVEISETAVVRGAQFTLGEVTKISGSDAELIEKAKEVMVGYSPLPGHSRFLRNTAIWDLLVASGFEKSKMRIQGSRAVNIAAEFILVDSLTLIEQGQKFIHEELKTRGLSEYIVEAQSNPQALYVPVGKQGYELQGAWRGDAKARGQAGIDLRILVDKERYRTIPLTYSIHVYGTAVTARRTIFPGEEINVENAVLQKVQLPGEPEEPVHSFEALKGRLSGKTIEAGAVVTVQDLRLVPLVEKGQAVDVILKSGLLTIRMRGIAQTDGFFGATVRVRNPESKKDVFGKVVDRGTVEIRMGASVR